MPLERPYNLRGSDPFPLEREAGRRTRGSGPMTGIFPRPCLDALDSSRICGAPHGFTYRDTAAAKSLSVSPLFGAEYRLRDESVGAFEAGLLATGFTGPLSFYLDARTFTELHEDSRHPSFDREFVERQDDEASGSIAYSSYSRYRGNLSFDLPWGRFTAARGTAHWGPGLFTNLSFNQASVPFNHATWVGHLGPVSVASLYGRLAIDGDGSGDFDQNPDTRSLYAHRYEWRVARDVLLGVSEQLIMYEQEEPFAVLPMVPLFIFKGNAVERRNNGNIAFDAAWRLPGWVRLYAEFFVDDLQSPTSLFDDYWGNKWACMGGAQVERGVRFGTAGAVAEYARVEPWVYTHYRPGTAQAANAGFPLGNQAGPNSQTLVLKVYARGQSRWYLSLQADLLWKGRDPGSALDDSILDETRPKEFLKGIGSPDAALSPYAGYAWNRFFAEAGASVGDDSGFRAWLAYRY